jgi:hypothetical protein
MVPGLIVPGQLISVGTRKPPSHCVFFSPRNIVVPPSGHVKVSAPLSVEYMTMVLSSMPSSFSLSSNDQPEHLANHAVGVDSKTPLTAGLNLLNRALAPNRRGQQGSAMPKLRRSLRFERGDNLLADGGVAARWAPRTRETVSRSYADWLVLVRESIVARPRPSPSGPMLAR